MARTPSTMLPLGTHAPDFSLVNVDGRSVSLSDFASAPALLVIFMCNHCPFVKHVADELARLASEYMDKGVAVVGINSNDVANYPDDSASHLAEEAIKREAKLDILVVAYKGTGAVITDLLGGHINAFVDAMPSSFPLVQSGKVKPLAVTRAKRIPQLPNVPTVAESGLAGYEMVSWYGVWAPAKLPPELAKQISAELAKAIRSPLASQRLGEQGFQAIGSTPEEFAAYIKTEVGKYAQIVKDANIKPE
jgi:tripartite-type tricarboxylate transporter receptor subunit TctC